MQLDGLTCFKILRSLGESDTSLVKQIEHLKKTSLKPLVFKGFRQRKSQVSNDNYLGDRITMNMDATFFVKNEK